MRKRQSMKVETSEGERPQRRLLLGFLSRSDRRRHGSLASAATVVAVDGLRGDSRLLDRLHYRTRQPVAKGRRIDRTPNRSYDADDPFVLQPVLLPCRPCSQGEERLASSPRRKTRQVLVGDKQHGLVGIGGDAPVALQTMTSTYTYDIDATVKQINDLHRAGSDLVRVAVPDKRDTAALKEILNQVRVPIIADVHFHFERALEAIEAGVHKIRLNPGNIKDRPKVE